MTKTTSSINRVAFIGNYSPRQCGIATFTTDLSEAVAAEYSATSCIALPVNDLEAGYAYPPRVRFELTEKDIDSYRRAADFLNINNVDIVTTFHTILQTPDADQRRVLKEIALMSDRIVVMSDRVASQIRDDLAGRLLGLYQRNQTDDWLWFEEGLTYCNAVLPQAMLMCGHTISNGEMTEAGLKSLGWLADLQCTDNGKGYFVPIGSNGFYQRGEVRARFDQQPVEAQTMVSACLEAYRITGDKRWHTEAWRAFEWFLGRNDLNLPIYDPQTGGCRDGLHADRLNENQGAESTLAFLQALLELRLAENTLQP